MIHTRRVVVATGCLAAMLTFASPAVAQFLGQPADLPIGEDYHVEILGGLWTPTPDITIASDAFGLVGTDIDFANDLASVPSGSASCGCGCAPGRKHRFRIDYVPIRYSAESVVERRLVFRGIAYSAGLPVTSTITWTPGGSATSTTSCIAGMDISGSSSRRSTRTWEAALASEFGREFARARAPIPAIGGVLRIYPLPVLGITAEVTGFRLPEGVDENYRGEYVDLDFYGTLNFTERLGAQIGYRSIDLSYLIEGTRGKLKLDGIYVPLCCDSDALQKSDGGGTSPRAVPVASPRLASSRLSRDGRDWLPRPGGLHASSRRPASWMVSSRLQNVNRTLVRPSAGS